MNEIYVVSREVKDRATGAIKGAQDYSQLGELLIVVTLIGLVVPLLVVVFVKAMKLKTA